jgi:hypothetical protein
MSTSRSTQLRHTSSQSSVAMDQLAGTKGTLPAEREVQFLRLRDGIERIASELFDGMPMPPGGKIRIFHHHIR